MPSLEHPNPPAELLRTKADQADRFLALRADLFVSTWALNESAWAAQDHVVGRRWFGARHLLMGMHAGVELADWAVADGARVEPTGGWMPGQTYVLR